MTAQPTVLMKIPPDQSDRRGNRVTADRWEGILRSLGYRVPVVETYEDQPAEVLIALHAVHGNETIRYFSKHHPDRPIILALTGTDLYRDLPDDPAARQSVELADRFVVLQSEALRELPAARRKDAWVIEQSVDLKSLSPESSWLGKDRELGDELLISVVGHLRWEKDPFRVVRALERIPEDRRPAVRHVGAEAEPGYADRARRFTEEVAGYRWVGEVSRAQALGLIDRSDLMVVSSRMEGGANVVSEALALETPVLASDIPGNRGLLPDGYPGLFPVEDESALAEIIRRIQREESFLNRLRDRIKTMDPEPASRGREKRKWRDLMEELIAVPS